MASYQELGVEVAQLRDMVEFLMSQFKVNKQYAHPLDPSQVIVETVPLLQVYREMKNGTLVVKETSADVAAVTE